MVSDMRRFRVEIGGKVYEVSVEEIEWEKSSSPEISITEHSKTTQPTKIKQVEMPLKAEPKKKTSSEDIIFSPMAGTITRLNKKIGDLVRDGDVIAVLEAMKMENDIIARRSGVVKEINVSEGKTVKSNDIIAVIAQG